MKTTHVLPVLVWSLAGCGVDWDLAKPNHQSAPERWTLNESQRPAVSASLPTDAMPVPVEEARRPVCVDSSDTSSETFGIDAEINAVTKPARPMPAVDRDILQYQSTWRQADQRLLLTRLRMELDVEYQRQSALDRYAVSWMEQRHLVAESSARIASRLRAIERAREETAERIAWIDAQLRIAAAAHARVEANTKLPD